MNCIFSAHRSAVPIDACVLSYGGDRSPMMQCPVGPRDSSFLQQAAYITSAYKTKRESPIRNTYKHTHIYLHIQIKWNPQAGSTCARSGRTRCCSTSSPSSSPATASDRSVLIILFVFASSCVCACVGDRAHPIPSQPTGGSPHAPIHTMRSIKTDPPVAEAGVGGLPGRLLLPPPRRGAGTYIHIRVCMLIFMPGLDLGRPFPFVED